MTKVGGAAPAVAAVMPEVEDDISVSHVTGLADKALAEGTPDSCTSLLVLFLFFFFFLVSTVGLPDSGN